MKVFKNAIVKKRGVEEISALAESIREKCGLGDVNNLNVVELLRRLEVSEIPGKGRLKIHVCPEKPRGYRAFVSFKPLELHVERLTFERARWNTDTYAKYVLAHETGHIVLHDQFGVPFSDGDGRERIAPPEEGYAESQADCFADHLLLPNHIVDRFSSVSDLMDGCDVSEDLARRQFQKRQREKKVRTTYAGEFCPNCANLTLARQGLLLQCDNCGGSFSGL